MTVMIINKHKKKLKPEDCLPLALPPSRDAILAKKQSLRHRVWDYLRACSNQVYEEYNLAQQPYRFFPQFDSCLLKTQLTRAEQKTIVLSRYSAIQKAKQSQ